MTNKDFYELMEKTFQECMSLAKAKGADYTKGSEDALANFKEGGIDLNLPPEMVLMVMFRKHWTAIINYVRTGGQSESEPIDERLKDLINYAVLLKALIHEKRAGLKYAEDYTPNIPPPHTNLGS